MQMSGMHVPDNVLEKVKTSDIDDCERCDESGEVKVEYEFEDGNWVVDYCERCATRMHEQFRIDRVVKGDFDLNSFE